MKYTFAKSDLADIPQNAAKRHVFCALIDALKHGGFMSVTGFVPKYGYGEVQNGVFQKGIDYGTALQTSLTKLAEIRDNSDFAVTVTRGTWCDENGNPNPTNRKSKAFPVYKRVTVTYKHGDGALTEAFDKIANDIHRSIDGETRPTVQYVKMGNGVYVHPETGELYLRDLRRISKQIVKEGAYPQTAKGEVVAIAETIKRDLPIGNYRMFSATSDFDRIVIDGLLITPQLPDLPPDMQSASEKVDKEKDESGEVVGEETPEMV